MNEFYVSMMDEISSKAYYAQRESAKFDAVISSLKEVRESISGVNIDEEIAQMLAMQHGYQAGARIVSAMDAMLDTLINRMAV